MGPGPALFLVGAAGLLALASARRASAGSSGPSGAPGGGLGPPTRPRPGDFIPKDPGELGTQPNPVPPIPPRGWTLGAPAPGGSTGSAPASGSGMVRGDLYVMLLESLEGVDDLNSHAILMSLMQDLNTIGFDHVRLSPAHGDPLLPDVPSNAWGASARWFPTKTAQTTWTMPAHPLQLGRIVDMRSIGPEGPEL